MSNTVEVHRAHCCPTHGCKYGERLCPIENKWVEPIYSNNNGCEQCEEFIAHKLVVTDSMCRAAMGYLYSVPRNPEAWEYEYQRHQNKIKKALQAAIDVAYDELLNL